jgi:Cu-Zn family superoxide dismutase
VNKFHISPLLAAFALAGFLSACASTGNSDMRASARLQPTQDNTAQGTVDFVPEAGGVRVIAKISGLTPGVHGFHIHEKGDCSAPDATSAGGHFNPHGVGHGKYDAAVHHTGDLPVLEASAEGEASLDVVLPGLALLGTDGVVGRGLIVHAGADDFVTQPTGNAGARAACAEIRLASEGSK